MNTFPLSLLIPTSGLVRAYTMTGDAGDTGAYVTSVTDESGSGANLACLDTSGTNGPTWSTLNGRKVMSFTGSVNGLTNATGFSMKDVFVMARYDGATFDNYRGVVSDATTNAIIFSNNSGTKFFDLTIGTVSYRKSGTLYTASTQEAPMNYWALVEMSNANPWAMDSFRVGRDRSFTSGSSPVVQLRLWKGSIGPIFAYSEVKSSDERRAIKLWYDLRYQLFTQDGTLEFPDPSITGIQWARFYRQPTDWSEVTIKHTYEDESASYSDTTDTPPSRWEIGFTGLTQPEWEIFDAFNEAARRKRSFSLRDKYGVTHTGVRIEDYERRHDKHESWVSNVTFKLVKHA